MKKLCLFPKAFIAILMSAAAFRSQAVIYFQNTGTTNGWTTLWHEDQGSQTQVVTPTYKGPEAVDCRTIFRPTYRGRYHTELRKGGMAALGMDRYYGFAFYLPPNWEFDNQSYNIQQFIASVDGCSGGQPATMTHLQNHSLITRITTGPDGCTRSQQSFTVTTNVTPGEWHRIVIHGNWQATNTGVFEFWYDGVRKVNQTNVPTIPNDNTVFNLAVGNYSNGWHDDGEMVGTQGTRDVFIDQVRVTDNYAEADPAAWSGPADGGQFALSVDSSSDSLSPGSNIVYSVLVVPFNGFGSNVTLSAKGLPPNVTANFNPTVVGPSQSSTLTLTAASNSVPGNYSVILTGLSGALGVTNTIDLTVNELAPSPDTLFVASDNAWVLRSQGTTVEDASQVLQVKRLADSNTRVIYTRFNLGSFFAHHSAAGITLAKLRLYVPGATSGGGTLSVYGLLDNVGGTNGFDALWNAAAMTWNNQPAKSAAPNDISGTATALPNTNTTASLGSAAIPATAGEMDVTLDVSALTNFLSGDSNQQLTFLFVNNSATIVSFASLANSGGYLQPELELVSPVSDFGIAVSPGSQNVNSGSNVTFTVTVSGSNGFAGDVALNLDDLPPGLLANLSTNTVTGSGSVTLTLSAAPNVSPATYVIPVTATSGTLQHSGAISLTVYVTDTDNDGIPDWWMMQYFNHATGQAGDESLATDDADGDGVSNYEEYLAGTDPTNPLSYLHATSTTQQGNDMAVTWTTVSGHSYVVQAVSGLGTNTFTDISPVISADGEGESTASYVDSGAATNAPKRFYRIRLSP